MRKLGSPHDIRISCDASSKPKSGGFRPLESNTFFRSICDTGMLPGGARRRKGWRRSCGTLGKTAPEGQSFNGGQCTRQESNL